MIITNFFDNTVKLFFTTCYGQLITNHKLTSNSLKLEYSVRIFFNLDALRFVIGSKCAGRKLSIKM